MAETKNEYDYYAPQSTGRLFNNAMFGFNKEEVLEYLEELAEENFQRQETAEQRIRELTQTAQMLETQLANQPQGDMNEYAQRQIQQLQYELEQARTASQQQDNELQAFKEQLFNAEKENAWLREEYQKGDQALVELQNQLDELSKGQWQGAEDTVNELQLRLQNSEQEKRDAENRFEQMRAHAEQLEARNSELERSAANTASNSNAAAQIILEEANEQANHIREEAWAEKERLQKQIQGSAGGLVTSITNLRGEISEVEGDVTLVLETVQTALAELLSALGRTEQNLSTFDTQVDRFPSSSPVVPKPQQQVVLFQPGTEIEPSYQHPNEPLHPTWRATQPQSLGTGGFRRVWPDGSGNIQQANTTPFRPSYSNSPVAAAPLANHYGNEAYDMSNAPEERMRNLAETLVDTLMQMMN